MITRESFEALLSPEGQAALAMAEERSLSDRTLLSDLEALRKHFSAELASAAIETVQLRIHAASKFSRAAHMYFTREALEQATSEPVARHRAARFAEIGTSDIWDLCCSIGGDLIHLAQHATTTGIDLDPLRLHMARHNAEVYGVQEHVRLTQLDVTEWQPSGALVFCDPARRSEGRRARQPEDYHPPLSVVERWSSRSAGMGVKVAPGIDYTSLSWPAFEVEVISLGGDVKEAVLWTGQLRRGERTATVLPQGATLTASDVGKIDVEPAHAYLYEPDGAVIRAHLVEQLAAQIGATKIDDEIAFLSTEQQISTPFARGFRIREVLPWHLKRLRHRLRELDIGKVVVKKRGSPIDPQVLERQLRLEGEGHAVIVLTHMQGKPVVIICDAVD